MERGACSAGKMEMSPAVPTPFQHQLGESQSIINRHTDEAPASQGGAAQARSGSTASQFRASALEASNLGLTLEIFFSFFPWMS